MMPRLVWHTQWWCVQAVHDLGLLPVDAVFDQTCHDGRNGKDLLDISQVPS